MIIKEFESRLEWSKELARIHGQHQLIGEELTDAGIYISYFRTKQFVKTFEYNPKTRLGEVQC